MDWIIPCNMKKYDIEGAFKKFDEIDWRQTMTQVSEGDYIYVYVGKPISALKYMCCVTKTNMSYSQIDDSDYIFDAGINKYKRYMRLKKICEMDTNIFERNALLENGLNTVQGPSRINEKLNEYIQKRRKA